VPTALRLCSLYKLQLGSYRGFSPYKLATGGADTAENAQLYRGLGHVIRAFRAYIYRLLTTVEQQSIQSFYHQIYSALHVILKP
jgi:hypothetical protein